MKGKLKEIKETFLFRKDNGYVSDVLSVEDIEWLIKQAEKMEKLQYEGN